MSVPAVFELRQGKAPLVISMPHPGTFLPEDIAGRMTDAALALPDTDWHLPKLYDFVNDLDASLIVATHSRYVIDLNRPPDDVNLYPGQDTTGLCPLDTFAREPIYQPGRAPDAGETQRRIEHYWMPYHSALESELLRLRQRHAKLVLWDAHSIRSVVPRLFQGRLPDLSLGTAGGASCDETLARPLLQTAQSHGGYSAVLNGRFKGGYITRHYGRPGEGLHAVQLELAQLTYMQEDRPYAFDESRAALLRPLLARLLHTVLSYM
jgi:N-formylglutamate deformylase